MSLQLNRPSLLLILSILGFLVAGVSGAAESLPWLAAICGSFSGGCTETAEFTLLAMPLWLWRAIYYAALAVLLYLAHFLVFWWAAVAFGIELSLIWIMVSFNALCIFCLINCLIVISILIYRFERQRLWQTLTVSLFVFIVATCITPEANQPVAAHSNPQDQVVVATTKGQSITAEQLETSQLYPLEMQIYARKKDQLDRMITERLLEEQAAKHRVFVQQRPGKKVLPQEIRSERQAGPAESPAGLPFAPPGSPAHRELAKRILQDAELTQVLDRARALLRTGITAGNGYCEVWIRDLNTFLPLALEVNEPSQLREALLTFLKFQGPTGDIVDGYIPTAKANVSYQYRRSTLAPDLVAHKNSVETDQETSLIQAIHTYVTVTGDCEILKVEIDGMTVLDRLDRALQWLMQERFDSTYGLLWGATTVDWGDVQPEHPWGVEFDDSSHRAIDIYDNAMFIIALDNFLSWLEPEMPRASHWGQVRDRIRRNVRVHLWDAGHRKFIPHVYLHGSPFPTDFDESSLYYHGGTAVAIKAGLLSPEEIRASLEVMRINVKKANAASIGLTVYPPYPKGFFMNPGMVPWSYQNGGDWCWFGGRMIQQLVRFGFVEEAYQELKPMVSRVLKNDGFYEWWTPDNQPRGSGQYRGSAGVLGYAIQMLYTWADQQLGTTSVAREHRQ